MRQTYKDAAEVLVIDAGIRSCSLSALLEEKMLHVLSLGWMQRLWTLQEGLLAQKLVFQFSDWLTTLRELLPVGEDIFDVLLINLASGIFRLIKYRQNGGSKLRLGDVMQSRRWRTTSKAGDETLAISGLLGIDAFELANALTEERMKLFLLRN